MSTVPATGDPKSLFDAVLTPHRSLGHTGFMILILGFAAVSLAAGIGFLSIGAWPVLGFFGLDVLLLYIAFKVSYARARQIEAVRLTREHLYISKIDAKGRIAHYRLQPYWLKLDLERDGDSVGSLRLFSHGRYVTLGNQLSPAERADFAAALGEALARVRSLPAQSDSPSTSVIA
ncbi:MAG: DUF2244 domain-containing protein [Alphaproteobacteria bacterium]|nr:DUF2244 domain-containing protein [Alphaproteobacteria bacterium]